MRPEDAAALIEFLTQPRTIREIAIKFKISKVTAAIWVRLFPVKVSQRREGQRGPYSKTFQIDRSTPQQKGSP